MGDVGTLMHLNFDCEVMNKERRRRRRRKMGERGGD
jgi:hypothetical protein